MLGPPTLPSLPNEAATAESLRLQAEAATAKGAVRDAEHLLRRAVEVAPSCVSAYVELASLLCRAGRAEEALAMLDAVLAARAGTGWALSLKAAVLETERRTEQALAVHETLVACAPTAAVPWLNYAHALGTVGRLDESIAAYQRSLECDPANGFAWSGLANLRTVQLSAEDVVAMERALLQADDLNRMRLHFALGKALCDIGSFEASFGHYEQANQLRGRVIPSKGKLGSDLVDQAASTLRPEFLVQHPDQGCDATDPIFIVGMPRSGTTLVEQILASHPLIEGMGELTEFDEIAGLIGHEAGGGVVDAVAEFDAADLKALGERYLIGARRFRHTDRPFFTDKMPSNWRYLGLIHLVLPNAKIIDVRRDPLACCFSAFTTYFNRGTRFPTTLEGLGRYYCEYAGQVDDFAAALPGRVHRLRYERLVDDLEGEVRRLLTYLGVPFDEACLRFHENERAVDTPSAQQVREPINHKGLERWRSYERWLGPLKQGLGLCEPSIGITNLNSNAFLRPRWVSRPGVQRDGRVVRAGGTA